MDLLQREGHYPLPPQAPKTLGVEFSGTIESEAEESEKGFKVGDEVFGLAYGGPHLVLPLLVKSTQLTFGRRLRGIYRRIDAYANSQT